MSVFRAILGRFARLLVRLARALDPGLAATPHTAIPERIAALRLRYPGAPEHWLELLARRTSIGDGVHSAHAEPATRTEQRPQFSAGQPAARPTPRFPDPIAKSAVSARRSVADARARPASEPSPAESGALRPVLSFGVSRVVNPIVSLVRGEPRAEQRPPSRFRFGEHDARREDQAVFARPHGQPAHDPNWIGLGGVRQVRAGAAWPEFRHSVAPGPVWPVESSRGRPSGRFAALDNRWPELPPLFDESETLVLRASDEAALLAEQMGGAWSA